MTTKLTPSQITALQFLSKAPWVAAWWGGKPHGRWPKELNAQTISILVSRRFVTLKHVGRFDRAATITEAGTAALTAATRHAEIKTGHAVGNEFPNQES